MARKLLPHPLIAELPEMDADEFAAFKADIRINKGIRNRIVLLDGKIIDGRHRYRALCELEMFDIDKHTMEFRSAWGDPWSYVVSQMQHRMRSPSIKAVEAELLMDEIPAERGEGKRSEIVAELFGISARNIEIVRQIRKTAPKFYAELRSGKINVKQAYNRSRHTARVKSVRKLHAAGTVTIDDCDLFHGDNVSVMQGMPDESVDVVFMDPPYNNGWVYRDDPSKDRLPDEVYLKRMAAVFTEAKRLLRPSGSLFVLIDGNYCDPFGMLLREAGLVRRNTIVWWETFGTYNSAETNLGNACRFIHYYSKTAKPTFNKTELRDPSARAEVYGDKRAVDAGKIPDNVWPASRVQGTSNERVPWQDKGQAPQLPIAVPERCILLASEPGEIVLDPFNGNGTSAVAALRHGRKYIGIDRDSVGLERSRQWIASMLATGGSK